MAENGRKKKTHLARVVFGDPSPCAKAPTGRRSKTTNPQIGSWVWGQLSLVINVEHVLMFTIFTYLGIAPCPF
jgi:hypothetical protein